MNGFPKAVGIVERNLLAFFVEPVPFPIVVEDGSEHPAMAVKVSELCGLQLLVEFATADFFQKFFIAPQSAGGSSFGIAFERLVTLLFRGIALLFRIHFVAVDFVVPPSQAEIGGDHVRAGMDVTDHALARGNGPRESVLDGMAGLIFGNRWIGGGAESRIAEL